ncbi:MAG: phosphatase PAP2 family protein [Ferruginibacter sp.]|nr:phosphatase PAP2 family protein [Cytophagales bacterium]
MDEIKQLDTAAFLWLNGQHSAFWDGVMYGITYRLTWVPFYALIIFLLFRRYRWQAAWLVLAIVLVITLADQTASAWMKPFFGRLRPCHEPALAGAVHVVSGCGGRFGFVSSHSANTFGLATTLWLLFRREARYIGFLFAWAFLVSYSRIYVGVHYPLDLMGGALVGIAYAGLVVFAYRKLMAARFPSKSGT